MKPKAEHCNNLVAEKALIEMERFLFNNLEYGFWIDFTKCHNGSTCWTTSYVGRNLAEKPKNLGKLLPVKNRIQFNQRIDGGWGYNHTSTSDADTTANCLLFLLKFPDTEKAVKAGIKYLLKHFDRKTGGISTYTPDEFRLYSNKHKGVGWCLANIEVTALATRAMIEAGYKGKEINRCLDFIISKQNKDGSWKCYWWSSKDYATVECIRVLQKYSKYKEGVEKALIYLCNKRRDNKFGWINDFTQKFSPFYAAACLGILLEGNLLEKHKLAERYQIYNKKEIAMLINAQNNDGNFGHEPLFRIPRYDIIDPSKIKRWDIEKPSGNSIYTDDNGLFTTATVYSTLLKFLNYKNEQ